MKRKNKNGSRMIVWLLFLLYILLMLWLLFGQRVGKVYEREKLLRIIPFSTIGEQVAALTENPVTSAEFREAAVQILGNIGMFVPFGAFLPALFERQRRFHCFLPTAVLTDIAVEGMQYILCLGFCDIDDLILNVPGMCIGWFLYTAAAGMISGRKKTMKETTEVTRP